MRHVRTIAYVALMGLRLPIRFLLRIVTLLSGVGFLAKLLISGWGDVTSIVTLGIIFLIAASLRHYYDQLLFRLAPEGQTLHLRQ